jgi:hypothetical protein
MYEIDDRAMMFGYYCAHITCASGVNYLDTTSSITLNITRFHKI